MSKCTSKLKEGKSAGKGANLECYNCGGFDHISRDCPQEDADARDEFEKAGGNKDDFDKAQREGAKTAAADKMAACFEDALTANSQSIQTASDAEKKTAKASCVTKARDCRRRSARARPRRKERRSCWIASGRRG